MLLSSRPAALQHSLNTVKRQIDLRCRVVRNLSSHGIAASHAGYEEPIVRENAGRSRIALIVVRRIDGPPISQVAHGDGANLNGRIRNASNAQHGASRRSFCEVFAETLDSFRHTC